MKKAKKNKILNIAMIAAIVLIAAAGILGAGRLRGWFDKTENPEGISDASERFVVSADGKKGSVNIYRGGVAYSLSEGTVLRTEDEVETLNLSEIELHWNGERGSVRLDENTRAAVHFSEEGTALELLSGALFADMNTPLILTVNGKTAEIRNGVFSASAPYGSGNVTMLCGEATLAGQTVKAGQTVSLLGEEQGGTEIRSAALSSLNVFELNSLSMLEESRGAVFTPADVAALRTEREEARQTALEAKFLEGEEEARLAALRAEEKNDRRTDENGKTAGNVVSAEELLPVCTIEIRCDTILDNMVDLADGKSSYVPANGIILSTSKLTFNEGETAFDVLKRACSLAGIQIEYSWTPLYNSYYVEGINHLYEFDCGEQSGWMYKVNGWFPNYGSSAYELKDGDVMVWCYTCKGLGADVGGSVY